MADMLNFVVVSKTFTISIMKNASLSEFFFKPCVLNKRKNLCLWNF